MDLVDNFLKRVTDEYGNKIDFKSIASEGFSGIICLDDKCFYLEISLNLTGFERSYVTDEESKMIEAFAKYSQRLMIEQKEFVEGIKNTERRS